MCMKYNTWRRNIQTGLYLWPTKRAAFDKITHKQKQWVISLYQWILILCYGPLYLCWHWIVIACVWFLQKSPRSCHEALREQLQLRITEMGDDNNRRSSYFTIVLVGCKSKEDYSQQTFGSIIQFDVICKRKLTRRKAHSSLKAKCNTGGNGPIRLYRFHWTWRKS